MKKLFKSVLCIILCVFMVVLTCILSTAASLAAPKSLKVSSTTSSSISLTWKKVSGATGYKISRLNYNTGKWSVVGSTKSTKYTSSNLNSVTMYSFKIRAYNSDGTGSYSSTVSAVTNPGKVTGLSQKSATSDSITISWKSTTRATGYVVYVYKSSTSSWVSLGKTTSNGSKLTGVTSGAVYSFKVRAYYQKGSSTIYGEYSNVFKACSKPDTVKNLAASAIKDGVVSLKWSKVSGNVKYQVYTYKDGSWSRIATVSSSNYSAAVSTSTAKFKVRAVVSTTNKTLYGSFSSVVTAKSDSASKTDDDVIEMIEAPKNFTLSTVKGQGYITLTWSKISYASGYEVFQYNVASGSWAKVKTTTSNTCKITVSESDTYYFRVRAYTDINGEKVYGNASDTKAIEYRANKNSNNSVIAGLEQGGVFGYLYDPTGNYFYTSDDPWQRVAGFTPIYDACAPLAIMFYDTIRLKFNADGLDWMIQLWKGQYGWVFIGGEVGVYTKTPGIDIAGYYFCADDEHLLNMSMVVKHKDKVVINRPYGEYWWCTGFVPGILPQAILGKISGDADTSSLTMIIRITTKSNDMLKGLVGALNSEGFKQGSGYVVSGLDVLIYWN